MKRIAELSDDDLAQLARRAEAMPDAPEALVNAAVGLFRAGPIASMAKAARSAANRVLAALAFDSWAPTPALAVRGAPTATRQMLFSAMGRDIDVRIAPVAGAFRVSGQVFGPDREGTLEIAVAIVGGADAGEPRTAALDDFGEFRIDGVQAGKYTLTLRVADADIELPTIDVGLARG